MRVRVALDRDVRPRARTGSRRIVWAHDHEGAVADTELPIAGVYALTFSPDAGRLAQTGADGKVRIWTLRLS